MKAGQPNACQYDSVPSPARDAGVDVGVVRSRVGEWAGHGGMGGRGESTSADEECEVGIGMADAVCYILAMLCSG